MKRTLNIHLSEGEHAWLKASAKFRSITITQVVRDKIRDDMRRELAEAGIAAGLRCARQDCLQRPVKDGYCTEHGEAVPAAKQPRRKRT